MATKKRSISAGARRKKRLDEEGDPPIVILGGSGRRLRNSRTSGTFVLVDYKTPAGGPRRYPVQHRNREFSGLVVNVWLSNTDPHNTTPEPRPDRTLTVGPNDSYYVECTLFTPGRSSKKKSGAKGSKKKGAGSKKARAGAGKKRASR